VPILLTVVLIDDTSLAKRVLQTTTRQFNSLELSKLNDGPTADDNR